MKILHFSIMVILVIVSSTTVLAFAQNATNSTNSIPPNAIRTPNGGWITPLQTHDANGTKLNIHYEVGTPVYGKVPPPVPNFITQYILSPLKQLKSGINAAGVICNDGLVRVFKTENSSPACVKLETKIELVVRGWANDDRLLLGCIGEERNKSCYPDDKDKYRSLLRQYYGLNATSEVKDPFVANQDGKIDLSKINLSLDKYGHVDYEKIGYLVSENKFKEILDQQNVKYPDDNFLLLQGLSLTSYPPFTDYCGYVLDSNKEEHWFSSSFHKDTLTNYNIYKYNPEPCKPGFDSCSCSLQTKIAENNLKELSYLTTSEEETVGDTVSQYLDKTNVVNVSNQFTVGKYNLQADPSLTHYCGKFTWGKQLEYFDGYIKDSNVVFFELATEKPKLCAINADAKVFSFEYSENGTKK